MSDHDTRQRERVEALRAIMTAPQTSFFRLGSSFGTSVLIHGAIVGVLIALFSLSVTQTAAPGGGSPLVVSIGAGGIAGSTETVIPKGVESGTRGATGEEAPTPDNAPQEEATPPEESAPPTPPEPAEPEAPAPEASDVPALVTEKAAKEAVKETPKAEEVVTEKAEIPVPPEKPAEKPVVAEKEKPKPKALPKPKAEQKAVKPKAAEKPVKVAEKVTPTAPNTAPTSGAASTASAPAALGTALGDAAPGTPASLPGSGDGLKKISEGNGDAALADNGDGTYRPTGKGNLRFTILQDAKATYPRRARSMGLTSTVRVKVQFVVNESGTVERARILTKNVPPLDFEEEALKAINGMRFEPIRLAGVPVKVTFVKTIVFRP